MFLVGYSLFVGIGFLEKVRVGKNITRYETIRRPLSPPPPPPLTRPGLKTAVAGCEDYRKGLIGGES